MRIISIAKSAILASSQIRRNVIWSLLQAVLSAACIFITIRIIITELNLSEFGVVSVLLAIAAASKIGDVGGGGALGRLIPNDQKLGKESQIANLIKTTVTSSLICFTLISFIGFICSGSWLQLIFDQNDLTIAKSVLPLIAVHVVISVCATAVASAIDGMQRADMRSGIMVISYTSLPLSTYIGVTLIGISGYIVALIVQQFIITILGWLVLRKLVPGLNQPLGWNSDCFSRTFNYVLKLNAMTIFALLFEPITKVMVQVAGGSSAAGLYEIASRAVSQIRNLVVSSSIPLIPHFAGYSNKDKTKAERNLGLLAKWYSLASLGTALLLTVATPIVCIFVFNELNKYFIITMLSLSLAWSYSILALPFYFYAQAQGIMRWNIIGHAISIFIIALFYFFDNENKSFQSIISLVSISTIVSTLVFILGNLRLYSLFSHSIKAYASIWIILAVISVVAVSMPSFVHF